MLTTSRRARTLAAPLMAVVTIIVGPHILASLVRAAEAKDTSAELELVHTDFDQQPAAEAAAEGEAALERRLNNRAEALRRALRRRATLLTITGQVAKARKLRAAASNDSLVASLVDDGGVMAADGTVYKIDWPRGDIGDVFIKIANWVLEHIDEIIAIVMKIIPLFAEPAPAGSAILLDLDGSWTAALVPRAAWPDVPLALAC